MFNLLGMALVILSAPLPAEPGKKDFSSRVYPFIGTSGHGHTYPGVCLPFGMVQLSPDTRLTGWDGCSAYHYSDRHIHGFSHTHLSGTGCSDYGDILFMPVRGKTWEGDSIDEEELDCRSLFRHEEEEASPGYYRVRLDDYDIEVELTATPRCGFHRYTFPESENAGIYLDLHHRDEVIESGIRIVGDGEIEGFRRSRAWAQDQRVFFVARFSKPFDSYMIRSDGESFPGVGEKEGKDVRILFGYSTGTGEKVILKVGLSAVSIQGARKNLEAEIPGWDFEEVRKEARECWNRALGKVRIEGWGAGQDTVFYTALYHTMLAPNLYMDVDGSYRGRDLEVHRADEFSYYTVFSLWDTYRAAHPWFTIVEPERTVDFIETMLAQYRQGGMLPVWELSANETGCMIGYHAVPVIADAYLKGIRGFDSALALESMIHSAEQDHLGLGYYQEWGYIPADKCGSSVSRTLEYAYDDWCIARMAQALGRRDTYQKFIQRAQYYKNLFDPVTGFMRAKVQGGYLEPFDPAELNFHYTEANAWQYSFYVPQDISGLIALLGGKDKFAAKLDELFSAASLTSGIEMPDVTGLIGQYAHGNEPSQHMAYLYNYAGRPWETQRRVREIMESLYTKRPDGLCGNEDCGQMSAWYVFSALGFYPVTPAQGIYAIGSPLFARAEIDVGGGRKFILKASGVNGRNIYIQRASLNGASYSKSWISHEEIMAGGEIEFEMGPRPNRDWGSGEGDIPISEISDHPLVPAPFFRPSGGAFRGSVEVSLGCADKEAKIYYTTEGSEPTEASPAYRNPFPVSSSSEIRALAHREGRNPSFVTFARYHEIPGDLGIELKTAYSSLYSAGGELALIDGVRGVADVLQGGWQGYQGVDLEAVIDLGREREISNIAAGFLQNQNSWIFMPSRVEYAVSVEGRDYRVIAEIINKVPADLEGAVVKEISVDELNLRTRYVRVRAKNIGVCPAWHRGAGSKAWIFVDEIVIE
ncbi:MAG: GH92 family glycosyl hydrolase [Candidatus Krumholzibacteriota bacterium]|nr:GH92 family glycosyl hydrolase [Candidatus Krumholzibacteriota bacterium]